MAASLSLTLVFIGTLLVYISSGVVVGASSSGYTCPQSSDGNCSATMTPQGCLASATEGEVHTDSDGDGSTNHRNYENCSWAIICPNQATYVLMFNLSSELETAYDYISYTNNQSVVVWSSTNNDVKEKGDRAIAGDYVLVRFTSDDSVTRNGFSVNYRCWNQSSPPIPGKDYGTNSWTCSATSTKAGLVETETDSGTVTIESDDDGYGSTHYASNENCVWSVQCGGDTSAILISSIQYQLITGNDRLYIYNETFDNEIWRDPNSRSSNTGSDSNLLFYDVTTMIVQMTTDSSSTRDGFTLTYECLSSKTVNNRGLNSSPTAAPQTSQSCSATATPQGTIFTATEGSSSVASDDDGSGSTNYQNYEYCAWTVLCGNDTQGILLTSISYDLESSYDKLRIYDTNGNESSIPVWTSEDSSPATSDVLLARTSYFVVVFTSDETQTYDGWTIDYKCLGEASYENAQQNAGCSGGGYCSATATPQGCLSSGVGSIHSDSDGVCRNEPVHNNEACVWTIKCDPEMYGPYPEIVIDKIEWDLEEGYDDVTFRNFTSLGSTVLWQTGSYGSDAGTQRSLSFSTSQLSVIMDTDGSNRGGGFSMTYRCQDSRNSVASHTVIEAQDSNWRCVSSSSSGKSALSGGAIAGIVIGSLTFLGFVVGVICCCCVYNNNNRSHSSSDGVTAVRSGQAVVVSTAQSSSSAAVMAVEAQPTPAVGVVTQLGYRSGPADQDPPDHTQAAEHEDLGTGYENGNDDVEMVFETHEIIQSRPPISPHATTDPSNGYHHSSQEQAPGVVPDDGVDGNNNNNTTDALPGGSQSHSEPFSFQTIIGGQRQE